MRNLYIDFSDGDSIKTAVVEDGKLVELFVDKKKDASIIGNVYLGIVKNILKSQFAFIDIGVSKNAFLDLSDNKEFLLYDENGKLALKPEMPILVQVVKDEKGEKGAAVSSQVCIIDNDIVVYRSSISDVGVSKKVEDNVERKRLKAAAKTALEEGYSVVLRTSCAYKDEEEICQKISTLIDENKKLYETAKYRTAPSVLVKDDYALAGTLKYLFRSEVDSVTINDEAEQKKLHSFLLSTFNISKEINVYSGTQPMFSSFFIQSQLDKALQKKLWLPSGGFIIIEETEAAVIVDVNTGKFSGKKTQQKTALKVNREASKEIAYQIRLRNLSGMILIDFIDIDQKEGRQLLLKELEAELKKDRIYVGIVGMLGTGLVQLTRKRTREPLSHFLQKPCPCCHGDGKIDK